MTEIVRPKKYTQEEIKSFIQDTDIAWQAVHADTLVSFIDILPAGSINVESRMITSFGEKQPSEFINSVTRVLKAEGVKDYSLKPDDKIMQKALKNFQNVDLSKYVSKSPNLIVENDFGFQLMGYMNKNKSSLKADKNFNPNLFAAVMGTFVAELPEGIKTQEDKDKLIEKMVPFAAGAIAKLSTKFSKYAGSHKMVLLADEDQKSLVLQTIRESMIKAHKSNTNDPKILELAGKEHMRGPNSLLEKVKRLFKDDSLRGKLHKEYKAQKAATSKSPSL